MYFTQIKTYFGQSTHDQLVDEFLPNSNLYLDKLVLNEWHIYGSSRLGIYKANVLVASKEVRINTTSANGQTNTTSDYSTLLTDAPILAFDTYSQTRGAKNYELSNHLGNVLVVITGKIKSQNIIMPPHISRLYTYLTDGMNILSHNYQFTLTNYAYKNAIYGLCEVLLWFKEYCQKNYNI